MRLIAIDDTDIAYSKELKEVFGSSRIYAVAL